MSKAKEVLELVEGRKEKEAELHKNLGSKEWVEAAFKKMSKKWMFSGDVNALEHGGTWWKLDGNSIEVVRAEGLSDDGKLLHMQVADYSVRDVMKNGPAVVEFVDATHGASKPVDLLSNVIFGMIHYYGGELDTFEFEADKYGNLEDGEEERFWQYMKNSHGIKE